MSLVRGIRSMSQRYVRNSFKSDDLNENFDSVIVLESDGNENCFVKLEDVWPKSIMLTAKIVSENRFEDISVERIENGVSFGKNKIFSSPIFHSTSEIKNKNNLCSKVVVRYENYGEYDDIEDKKYTFFGDCFDDYKITFSHDDILFEKDFLVQRTNVTETIAANSSGNAGVTASRKSSSAAGTRSAVSVSSRRSHKLYPCGGFFEYGAHPKTIESCVFQIYSENAKSTIRIWKFSRFFSRFGIDPSKNSTLNNGDLLIGISELSSSQKVNLYDEILSGACRFSLFNNQTGESKIYQSSYVFHVSDTDLIKIIFQQQKEQQKKEEE